MRERDRQEGDRGGDGGSEGVCVGGVHAAEINH